jgi:hypothetical protein
LSNAYGRYGYGRIWALLRTQSWQVSLGRVERIWWLEGLKALSKQPKPGRLWLNDGSCVRRRPCWRNHVWSYEVAQDRTDGCGAFRRRIQKPRPSGPGNAGWLTGRGRRMKFIPPGLALNRLFRDLLRFGA